MYNISKDIEEILHCDNCRFGEQDYCSTCYGKKVALSVQELFSKQIEGWYDWGKQNCRSELSFVDLTNFIKELKIKLNLGKL